LVGLLTFDKLVGGHALAGTHEGRGDLRFDVCIDRAAFLATAGTYVEGFLTGAAVGGLGIDGHEDDLDALGLARLGRDGVAVGKLAVVGRDNAAVFESDGAAFENPVDRDQFAVGERLTCGSRFGGGPAVGAEQKLVAFGHGDRPRLEDPKAFAVLGGVEAKRLPFGILDPEHAVLKAEDGKALVTLKEQRLATENNYVPRFIASNVAALGVGHVGGGKGGKLVVGEREFPGSFERCPDAVGGKVGLSPCRANRQAAIPGDAGFEVFLGETFVALIVIVLLNPPELVQGAEAALAVAVFEERDGGLVCFIFLAVDGGQLGAGHPLAFPFEDAERIARLDRFVLKRVTCQDEPQAVGLVGQLEQGVHLGD